METERELTGSERRHLARLLREHKAAQQHADDLQATRDRALRDLRWGADGSTPVRFGALLDATGLSRTTLYRAVGTHRERPTDGSA